MSQETGRGYGVATLADGDLPRSDDSQGTLLDGFVHLLFQLALKVRIWEVQSDRVGLFGLSAVKLFSPKVLPRNVSRAKTCAVSP
jgi:hypothetical protein